MVANVVLRLGVRTLITCLLMAISSDLFDSKALAADSGEAQWIWVDDDKPSSVPVCYFRKTFSMGDVERAELKITGDDKYELFVNGRRVGTGSDWQQLKSFDLRSYLVKGRNVVAVKCDNESGTPAAWSRSFP